MQFAIRVLLALILPTAEDAYIAKTGAVGHKYSSNAGGRAAWSDVPAAERSRWMSWGVRARATGRQRRSGRRRSNGALGSVLIGNGHQQEAGRDQQ
jgi:hypothetical protein